MEEKDVGAAGGAARAETAGQKLSAPEAHSHSGRAQAGNYTPKNLHLLLGVFTRRPLSCLSKTWAALHQGRNVFLPPFLF